ncbi:unnamed protein product, partial [Penicillium bialowiezense]
YADGPFKLICDDFGPANMIVKSEEDLTIVGVVDLEWAYAGPAQLFGSAPWWLLHDRPVNEEWDFKDGNAPRAKDRYFHCLEIFKRVLAKEETAFAGSQGTKLSDLISWSEASEAMYVHMLLSAGFFNPFGFPCKQLEAIVGSLWWILRIDEVEVRPEVKQFVTDKDRDLDEYEKKVKTIEKLKERLDCGQMQRDEFIVAVNKCMALNR